MRQINHKKNKLLHFISGLLFSLVFISGSYAQDQNIDIGIFEYDGAFSDFTDLTVKIIPDIDIPAEQAIDGILFTIRWPAEYSDITITNGVELASNYLYQVSPQGDPELYEGYYYLTMAATPGSSVGEEISAGDELVLTVYAVDGTDENCASFEIIDNEWTEDNNGGPYFSVGGLNSTGIIYEPVVFLGSDGGWVSGGGEINLGESTGNLELVEYQGDVLNWQKRLDGGAWNDISSTSGQQIYSEVPESIGTWEYRAVVQEGSCSEAYAEPAVINVTPSLTEWGGDHDIDWHNNDNWTVCVPDNAISAKINGAKSHQPTISGSDPAECKNLTIADGSATTIESDGKLTVYGTLTNVPGNGGLVINSTAGSSGSLIHTTANVQATYNQELSGNKWHDITPVIQQPYGALYMGMYIRQWNEPEGEWSDWLTDPEILLEPMRGYQVWVDGASGVVEYQGKLITGSHDYSLTRTGTGDYAGFNLVGNPYVSSIDWNSSALTKQNIENTFWVWNGTAGNYATYNGSKGTNGGKPEIPPSQAFFVVVGEGKTTGTFGVDNDARIHSGDAILKDNSDKVYGEIHFHVSGESYSDENILHLENGYSDSFDSDKDAYKLAGSDKAPQMYTKTTADENLAIDYRAVPAEDSEIALYFEKGEDEQYTIELKDAVNMVNAPVYLEDLKKDTLINILEEITYTFNSSEEDDIHRFNLVFANNPVSAGEIGKSKAKVYTVNQNIVIEIPDSNMLPAQLMISDIQGKTIKSETIQENRSEYKIYASSGVYVVTLIHENYVVNKKVIINK